MAVRFVFKKYANFMKITNIRQFSDAPVDTQKGCGRKGLVLGVYYDPEEKEHKLTPAGQKFNSQSGGKLQELVKDGIPITKGKAVVFQNLDPEFYSVAVAGLGTEDIGYNVQENLDEAKENIRIAAGAGTKKLKELGVNVVFMEGMGNSESAAEGAALAMWRFQEFKNKKDRMPEISLELYFDEDKDGWQRGLFKADAQNLARTLSDIPANHMTPTLFARHASDALCPCGVSVEIRDKDWMEHKKMNAILAVARGSCEPPVFLELSYCGGTNEDKPICFVGKGITFDAGGLCVKKCEGMAEYRADMAGAAVIVAVLRAAAALSLPMNLNAVIPLCENMPSGMAIKPGDVVTSLNGKNIQIDDTDNEGRLILADGMIYAQNTFKPKIVVDVATLTPGLRTALGGSSSGVFTNNHELWKQLSKAGAITGDRVWRFPLWEFFSKKVTKVPAADISNVGIGPGGGPCRAAAFLWEFIPCIDWIHFDIRSCGMLNWEDYPYLSVGRMTGRPTRTIIQFLYQLACAQTQNKKKEEGG